MKAEIVALIGAERKPIRVFPPKAAHQLLYWMLSVAAFVAISSPFWTMFVFFAVTIFQK